jgi:restriction endonuclease S subunit
MVSEKQTDYSLIFGEDVYRYSIKRVKRWIKFSEKEPAFFKEKSLYLQPKKIVVRRVADEIIAAIDEKKHVTLNTLYCFEMNGDDTFIEYLCALLNSKLLNFWFRNRFVLTEKLFPYIRISQLEQVPIYLASKPEQEPIVRLVERMLALNKQLIEMGEAKTAERARLEGEIARTDAQIDDAVYALYGISDDEKKIIERSVCRKS